MKPSRRLLLSACIIGGCFLLVLLGFVLLRMTSTTQVPAGVRNLPPYPKAEQVADENSPEGTRTISFQTSDPPDVVCRQYKDNLAKDWWGDPSCQMEAGEVTAKFEWVQSDINGPTDTAYRLTIVATSIANGKTVVTVKIVRFDPR